MFLYLIDSHTIKGDYLENSERLIQSFIGCLGMMNVSTEIQSNKIYFKNIRKCSTDLGENKINAIKLLREGEIYFTSISSSEINILLKVNLEYLIFMSVLFGVVIGFIVWFYFGCSLDLALLLLILLSVLVYVIGRFVIKEKMKSLIDGALKKNDFYN